MVDTCGRYVIITTLPHQQESPMEYKTRVCGIPCTIKVTELWSSPEYYDCPADGDFNFELDDRKGYRAKWLEAKVANDDREYGRLWDEAEDRARYDD
jgi:hypothetical protein